MQCDILSFGGSDWGEIDRFNRHHHWQSERTESKGAAEFDTTWLHTQESEGSFFVFSFAVVVLCSSFLLSMDSHYLILLSHINASMEHQQLVIEAKFVQTTSQVE